MKTLNPAVGRVLKRLHYPLEVILTRVRWYMIAKGQMHTDGLNQTPADQFYSLAK